MFFVISFQYSITSFSVSSEISLVFPSRRNFVAADIPLSVKNFVARFEIDVCSSSTLFLNISTEFASLTINCEYSS